MCVCVCVCVCLDAMLASSSLDGMIVLWSTLSLNPMRKFNEHEKYRDQQHCYPHCVNHLVALEGVSLGCRSSSVPLAPHACLLWHCVVDAKDTLINSAACMVPLCSLGLDCECKGHSDEQCRLHGTLVFSSIALRVQGTL